MPTSSIASMVNTNIYINITLFLIKRDVHFKDKHVNGYNAPSQDAQQDYTLVSASESNGITMVHCKRKLLTKDDKDFQIKVSIKSDKDSDSFDCFKHKFHDSKARIIESHTLTL
jgi:hypothetical protein